MDRDKRRGHTGVVLHHSHQALRKHKTEQHRQAPLDPIGGRDGDKPGAESDQHAEISDQQRAVHVGECHDLDLEAGLWLAQQDVALIGADNYAVEVLPFAPGTVFPVHQCVIRDYGIALLEGMQLKPLVETGRREFLFVAAPLTIVGATGSPLTPLAVL